VRIEVQLLVCQALDFLAEPAIKFLIIGPEDNTRIGMHPFTLSKPV
jgi:hypothetical protein